MPHWFLAIWLLGIALTLVVRATTYFIVKDDRLIIRQLGFVRKTILFSEIEDIECESAFVRQSSQIALYQLSGGKLLRLTKKSGTRYVLINPSDPQRVIKAWSKYWAQFPSEKSFQVGLTPLPDFLRPVR